MRSRAWNSIAIHWSTCTLRLWLNWLPDSLCETVSGNRKAENLVTSIMSDTIDLSPDHVFSSSISAASSASAPGSGFAAYPQEHHLHQYYHPHQGTQYQWMYSLVDSSRVSTFLISMLLIVYGSFRSLNMEQEAKMKEKQDGSCSNNNNDSENSNENSVQTLDTMQALCLPLGASVSLLVMFFFFDSMQMLFAICTAIIAAIAMAFLLLPMCQYILRPCTEKRKK